MKHSEDLAGRWYQLKDRAVFRLTGEDRVRYLNGQVSNDISRLEGRTMPACLCTIKGKVEALVWIHAEGDALILDGELRQRDFIGARLERYLIADHCEIEDLTGGLRIFHHFLEAPLGCASARLRVPGTDLFIMSGEAPPLPGDREISTEEWQLLETLSIIPRSGSEINADEFPAELGLEEWAVDFHKGCYLGQEIVSRIRSVGKVRRALRLVDSERPLKMGEPLAGKSGERGRVTRDSIALGEKKHLTLALVDIGRESDQPPVNQRVISI